MTNGSVDGMRVAILLGDNFEQVEMTEPRTALDAAGAHTTLVSPVHDEIHGVRHDRELQDSFRVDLPLVEANPEDFDALLLPGGALNADSMRMVPQVQEFIRGMQLAGKPIAAICHAPWELVSAGLVTDRTLTSYYTLQDDIRNAGGTWLDREVVRDQNIVTSRQPANLPAFNREMLALFAEHHSQRPVPPSFDAVSQRRQLAAQCVAMQNGHYEPPVRFGLGGVSLGNEFEALTDEAAYETLDAAWRAGVRYYDVAPWYGLGLAERRFGNYLHNKNREDYILSTKVGKLLKASQHNSGKSYFPFSPSPNDVVFDYTSDGVRRSVEDSLQRLGVSHVDIVFVHDISPDNELLPTPWQQQFDIAVDGAFQVLSRMKAEGMIRGWGIGVNTPEPILRVMREADPDVCLLASQYSLIEHANALHNIFPVARQCNVKFVIGSSLNAGFISGSPRYNYGKNSWYIPQRYIDRRDKLQAVAAEFGVDLRTAALRFSSAPDVVAALVVGARSADQIVANVRSMQTTIPPDFWSELKRQRLIEQDAPTPS